MARLNLAPEPMALASEVVEYSLGFRNDKESLLAWRDRDGAGFMRELTSDELLGGHITALNIIQAGPLKVAEVKMRGNWDRDIVIRFVAEDEGESVNQTGLRLLAELSSADPAERIQISNMRREARDGLRGVVAGAYQMGFALNANYGTQRPNVMPAMPMRSEALANVLERLKVLYPNDADPMEAHTSESGERRQDAERARN